HYRSGRGHAIRTLAIEGDADFHFQAGETAEQVVTRVSKQWPCEWVICWLPELFPPPREIEGCPVRTAAIVSDWNVYFPQLEYNLSRYDVVLTDKLGAQVLGLHGAHPQYLFPLYSQRSHVHRKLPVDKDIDVLFVGHLNHAVHAERARCLEKLAALSDRYRVVICEGYLDDAYARLLNRAKIVFNHSVRREMNLRCFETLACGSLLFLEESNLEAPDYLRDREEVVYYRPENLVDLVEHYLARPEEREHIAQQGRQVGRSIAGEHRLDALFDWLADQPGGTRAFEELAEEERTFAEILQYGSSLVRSQCVVAAETSANALRCWPERPEFLAAAGCLLLEGFEPRLLAESENAARQVLSWFHEAATRAADAIVLWMNLAFVCRRIPAVETEERCLQEALQAGSTAYGGLLLGSPSDPHYVAWRRSLALGKPDPNVLRSAAAARLAELFLAEGKIEEAREFALKSVHYYPRAAVGYRVLAETQLRGRNPRGAVECLGAGLVHAPFDAEYRTRFLEVLLQLNEHAAARTLAEESFWIFNACPHLEKEAAYFSLRRLDRRVGYHA
ncbi:MAG: glycosyltransferase family 1 protein, partial [Candidatus Hydrogenedentes bacterium]|nr:glycosyltransferase family 1 protein [Candidatus Hydrogenedentota bacterium]